MPTIDHSVETPVSRSVRARQLESIFDVPVQEKCRLQWRGELPIDEIQWNIGLIVGPSGCGKSSILRHVFGETAPLAWIGASVIDDFATDLSIEQISTACQSVGFNTIPAWLRPFSVLSNGERFRVEVARRMLETNKTETIAIDEFTSVVDRQVAQIASHAVQKFVRKEGRRLVAASCHYDVIDWLQPDWVLEPATMNFTRRLLQRRPAIDIEISRVDYSAWRLFSPYHYMSSALHRAARCFVIFVDGKPANFAGVLHRPISRGEGTSIYGVSRSVTLPDYQGIGLNSVMNETLGAAFLATNRRLHLYPASPVLIRQYDRSEKWALVKKPTYSNITSASSTTGAMGGRPCAVFRYAGEPMEKTAAMRLLA